MNQFSDAFASSEVQILLRFNHRISTDIDLFTDVEYGSLDFNIFQEWLKGRYPYYECPDDSDPVVLGRTYYIGESKENAIKLDLMYENEMFLFKEEMIDGIVYADVKEIAVMKLDAIFYGGRKKDFWDLHYLLFERKYSLSELIDLHARRFPYQHDHKELVDRLTNFDKADDEPDPICRLGKSWEIIKLDLIDAVQAVL